MILGVLGALGGVAAFVAGAWVIIRSAIRQSDKTDDNAKRLDRIEPMVNNHETRISVLEVWKRNGYGKDS